MKVITATVAIAVILAVGAGIAVFWYGLGRERGTARVQFSGVEQRKGDGSGRAFHLEKTGGPDIDMGDVKIVVRNAETGASVVELNATGGFNEFSHNATYNSFDSLVTRNTVFSDGDSIYINERNVEFTDGQPYRIELVHRQSEEKIDQGWVRVSTE